MGRVDGPHNPLTEQWIPTSQIGTEPAPRQYLCFIAQSCTFYCYFSEFLSAQRIIRSRSFDENKMRSISRLDSLVARFTKSQCL